jgi:hypothetical protein
VSKCLERGAALINTTAYLCTTPTSCGGSVQQRGYQARDSSPLGPGLCGFLDMDFREFPFRDCPKRGTNHAQSVDLGGVGRRKWAEKYRFGSPECYAAGSFDPFRTVSEGEFSELRMYGVLGSSCATVRFKSLLLARQVSQLSNTPPRS